MSSTAKATWRMPGVFAGAVPVVVLARGRVELRQLESSMAVRGLHDRDFCPDAVEPHDAIHPPALDRPLALQLESELDEELSRGREVVNDDAHVVHSLDSHMPDGKDSPVQSGDTRPERPSHFFSR